MSSQATSTEAVCWFCGKNPAGRDSAYQGPMYRRGQQQGTYQVTKRPVPRCEFCESRHAISMKVGEKVGMVALALEVVFVVGLFLTQGNFLDKDDIVREGVLLFFAVLFGALGVGFVAWKLTELLYVRGRLGIRPSTEWKRHASVAAAQSEGWRIGNPPRRR